MSQQAIPTTHNKKKQTATIELFVFLKKEGEKIQTNRTKTKEKKENE